ncbi:hypothetical protein [Polaribacter aquimarinus]|uniref:Uncharacterized protein n=1 Tax=Polaribacter aquimarinus TaxID=2100726 RepID=A0A2U2JD21_9FLAO|nr:hypothetical protein [Polaribacter aquimarinus]PWG06171.1 hypothetical protein DIS07_07005 [Polaribacter aquimarinus]
MAGEGFVAHMIASLKSNKRNRVSTFDKIKDFKKSKKSELYFKKKASPLELKKIKEKILQENERNFRRKIFILIVSIIVLLFLLN